MGQNTTRWPCFVKVIIATNVDILQRIDAIRRTENLVYELSPQAVMDRCEALFEESLEKGRYEAAIGALRLQAKVGGLLRNDALPAPKRDLAGAIDYAVRAAVSKYVTFGTLGSLNPLAPPPWPPGEEAARRKRRKMEREQDLLPPLKPGGTLAVPEGEEAAFRAAVSHEDAFRRADGLDPVTPAVADWTPDNVREETERAYEIGRTPDTTAPPADYVFPPEDEANEDGVPQSSEKST